MAASRVAPPTSFVPPASAYVASVVAESNGTYYGQKMTKGDVYTIAGDVHGGTRGV